MKKNTYAILLTVALVTALPFSALAAGSKTTGLKSGGGGGSATTSSSSATTTADGQSLSANGAGSQAADVLATFAVEASATAGLPEQVVASITSINAGGDLAAAVGNTELEGYAALAKTAAIVLNDKTTNATVNKEVPVTLYVPNLVSNLQNVKILYFENVTGQWKVVEPTAVDFENKTVSFSMYGSGTVTVIHK